MANFHRSLNDIMDKIIGVLGGDQLGRMLQEAANRLNVKTITLEKDLTLLPSRSTLAQPMLMMLLQTPLPFVSLLNNMMS